MRIIASRILGRGELLKLVTYSVGGGEPRVGSLEGEEIRPLAHEDMIEFIEYGGSPEPGEDTVSLGQARIHASIARPQKVIGIGLNYEDHAAETGADIPEKPIVFAKYPNTVIGPGEAIRIPPITEQADYEAELAVVIGRAARNVSEAEALDYIFGYTNANDVSSRDLQFSEGGEWTRSKSLDTFAPMGPFVATRDEVPDPQNLSVRCILNGEVVQDGTTSKMIFSVAELISFLSKGMTLTPGDEVTIEIEGLGALTNPVETG